MGTEYSRLMENMVDGLRARVKELEARAERAERAETAFGPLLPPSNTERAVFCALSRDNPEANMEAVPRQWLLSSRSAFKRDIEELNTERRKAEAERDAALVEVERLARGLRELHKRAVLTQEWAVASIIRGLLGDKLHAVAPELWPCGHEKVRHNDGCRECSP